MADGSLIVASAVILPEEPAEPPRTTSPNLKRRQSSFSNEHSKRPRLSHNESNNSRPENADPAPNSTTTSIDRTAAERRKSGQVEERKRGQRLFGALLGTLSQSSSSTAQKRRTDIERKQQAKLKLQAEEQDEQKKRKRESLLAVRRKEQVRYDKQSMHIRHSNMLAQAHFLRTKTEPRLYYKPWELLPDEEEKIQAQKREAEEIVDKETTQWDEDHAAADPEHPSEMEDKQPKPNDISKDEKDKVGSDSMTNGEASSAPANSENTNMDDVTMSDLEPKHTDTPEVSKDHGDDGGEELIGEEDTVIY